MKKTQIIFLTPILLLVILFSTIANQVRNAAGARSIFGISYQFNLNDEWLVDKKLTVFLKNFSEFEAAVCQPQIFDAFNGGFLAFNFKSDYG